MPLLNQVDVPTSHGWRRIELRAGDITQPDPGCEPDVLVVSSFRNSYAPTQGSVIGQLKSRFGISVEELAKNPAHRIDDGDAWLSLRLPETAPFKQLACVEFLSGHNDLSAPLGASIENVKRSIRAIFGLLAVAEINGLPVERVAMPMLGTGKQGLSLDAVLPSIVEITSKLLTCLHGLHTVDLYVFGDTAAASEILNRALDRDESQLLSPASSDEAVMARICAKLRRVVDMEHQGQVPGRELLNLLSGGNATFVTLAGQGRRLAEAFCQSALRRTGDTSDSILISMIEDLAALKVSPWIRSYLHTLRVLGNEAAHEKQNSRQRVPAHVDGGDLSLLLLCLDQVLGWWLTSRP